VLAREDERVQVRERLRKAIRSAVSQALLRERVLVALDRETLLGDRLDVGPRALGIEEEGVKLLTGEYGTLEGSRRRRFRALAGPVECSETLDTLPT
jgi:hypothetical protein